MTAGGAPLRRYPGAAPFSDSPLHRKLFFGRSKDAKNLVDTILADALVVLYAKSGTGKTSLVNVEVKERLREQGYAPLVVRVDKRDLGPLKTVFDGIRQAAADQRFEHQPGSQASLWHYFKTTELWREDLLLKPVLIIDQFEELFTLHGPDAREAMIKQLAHLLRGPAPPLSAEAMTPELAGLTETMPAVKVVLSMREDFLANLDELSRALPNILTTRYRLGPLGREQARQAIDEPATVADDSLETPQFAFESGVVEKVLGFLASRSSSIEGGEIEPFQIQVVCQHVEEMVRARAAKAPGQKISISFGDLGGEEGLRKTILEFYERQLNALPRRLRRRVERLCEQGLASREGRRLSQEQDEIQRRFKIDETLLGLLVQSRLLRSEPRLGGHHYELSHDTLLFPVLRARDSHVRRRRLQFAGATLLVALVPMIYIAIDQYHKHFLRKQAELLQQYDQAPESDSEGRLILALGAVGAGLRAGAPDPRAVEILALADQREATTMTTLPADVSVAVLSPSAQSVATATKSGRVELRDPAGKSWRVLEAGPWAEVNQLTFSADGTHVAAAAGSTVRVWDITGRKVVDLTIPGTDKSGATALAFDPSSDAVFIATSAGGWTRIDGTAVVKGDLPKGLSQAPVLARFAISPDGKSVYGVSPRGLVYAWKSAGQYQYELPVDGGVNVWAASPDGSRVAAIVGDRVRLMQGGRVRDVSLTESKTAESAPYGRPYGSHLPTSLGFSPDGDQLAVGMSDGDGLIFSLTGADARMKQKLVPDAPGSARAIAWSRSGNTVAVVTSEFDYTRSDFAGRMRGAMSPMAYQDQVTFFTLSAPRSAQGPPVSEDPARRSESITRPATGTSRMATELTSKDAVRFSTDLIVDSFWFAEDNGGFVRDVGGAITRITRPNSTRQIVQNSAAIVPVSCADTVSAPYLVQPTLNPAALTALTETGTTAAARWRWAATAFGDQSPRIRAAMCATDALYAVTVATGRPRLWRAATSGGQFAEVTLDGGAWIYPGIAKVFAQNGRFLLVGNTGQIQTLTPDGKLTSATGLEDRPILPNLIFDRDGRLVNWSYLGDPVRQTFGDASGDRVKASPALGLASDRDVKPLLVEWLDGEARGVTAVAAVGATPRVVAVDDRGDVHLLDADTDNLDDRRVWKTALQNVEQISAATDANEVMALSRNSSSGAYSLAHIEAQPQARMRFTADRIAVGARGQFVTTLVTRGDVYWRVHDPNFDGSLTWATRLAGDCTPSAIAASPVADEIIIGCDEGLLKKRSGTGMSLPDPLDAFEVEHRDCAGQVVDTDGTAKSLANRVSALAYEPSGRFFAGAAAGGRLVVWASDGTIVARPDPLQDEITNIAFGSGQVLAAGLVSGKILLWKLEGSTLKPLPVPAGFGVMNDDMPTSLEFSPDGTRLLIGFEEGTIRLLDWSAKTTVKEITMHSRRTKENVMIASVAFFPDGHRFAASSSEGEFQVWSDLGEAQTPLIPVGGPSDGALAVAVLPDGRVATSFGIPLSESPSVRLDDWVTHACNRLRFSNRLESATDAPGDAARDACSRHAAGTDTSDRQASFRAAAAAGRTSIVESTIQAGANPNVADASGRTALMQALGEGHTDTALALLARGADARPADDTKQTALHYAARGDGWRVVSQLVAAGLTVDQPDINGRTPLMIAAWRGNTRTMQALLATKASINAVDEFGRTALMRAAEADQAEAVGLLVHAGADPNLRDRLGLSFGRTALQLAIERRATQAADRLKSDASPEVVANGDNTFVRFPVAFLSSTPERRESALGLAAWTAGTANRDQAAALLRTLESRAAAGAARDITLLGLARAIGLAGTPDWKAARDQFKTAGQRGDLLGDSLYGTLLASGLGGKQDIDLGIETLRRARERGEPFAAWSLTGFEVDSAPSGGTATSALKMLSGDRGKDYGPAWNYLALIETGQSDSGEARLTAACETKIKQELDRAIELGDSMAVRNAHERLWLTRGEGVSFDRATDRMLELARSVILFSNPAVRPESLMALDAGVAHENGAGVPQDHAAAMKWLTKATEWGDAAASRELGRIYELGLGEPASMPTALRYYRRAAASGDYYARIRLLTLAYGF